MIKFDQQFLDAVGLAGLPTDSQQRALRHFQQTLQQRVYVYICATLPGEELTELESVLRVQHEGGAAYFLKARYPQYGIVVLAELARLRANLARQANAILAIESAFAPYQQHIYEGLFQELESRRTV